MATGQGTVTFDFGSAPGTNIVQATVIGQGAIGAGSKVDFFLMGTDSTVNHNGYEHALLSLFMGFACMSITPASGFVAQAMSNLRLTGLVTARFVWAD
jgi:hypothetical protein